MDPCEFSLYGPTRSPSMQTRDRDRKSSLYDDDYADDDDDDDDDALASRAA